MQRNVDGNTFRNSLFNNILKWFDRGFFKHISQKNLHQNPKRITNLLNWFNHYWSNLVIGVKRLKVERRSSVVGLHVSVWSSHHQGGFVHCDDKFVKSQISKIGTGKTYFVPWEQGWGLVWQQWRMWRPPRELGKRHNSRTLSLKKTICWVWMWLGSKMLQIFVVEEFDPDFSFICWSSPVMSKLPFWSRSWICSNNPFPW